DSKPLLAVVAKIMYQSAFSANRLMILTHYKGINLLIKLLDDLFNFVYLYNNGKKHFTVYSFLVLY
ncbi:MAG TPA: hypothetical protein VF233_05675, partial [Nitrososphaeraceae archaeon]